jgi:hypothetical protein
VQLVETILRPARVAWVLPTNPSARAANRTFRIATARWGGRYDVIVQRDPGGQLSEFAASSLALADPDFIFSVNRDIARHDWTAELTQLRIQPFHAAYIPAAADLDPEWGTVLRGRPTAGEDDEAIACPGRDRLDLRLAAGRRTRAART